MLMLQRPPLPLSIPSGLSRKDLALTGEIVVSKTVLSAPRSRQLLEGYLFSFFLELLCQCLTDVFRLCLGQSREAPVVLFKHGLKIVIVWLKFDYAYEIILSCSEAFPTWSHCSVLVIDAIYLRQIPSCVVLTSLEDIYHCSSDDVGKLIENTCRRINGEVFDYFCQFFDTQFNCICWERVIVLCMFHFLVGFEGVSG
ncbi:hypothetical protein BDF20DRAFT_840551 [Mycotypha africana]|uniref:uncharacterized protein n=1 Tax=Mycotypha africana TaxID=64632 RepID=UPI002301807E|nr:uncharacterized protein BDF20DRAFT_840551 [Mycotypha africana]KAI8967017.1 hypothetical protein BDF20DRAFT_840551 [Mycotypha africana]